MERDYGKEIDGLRQQIEEIKRLLTGKDEPWEDKDDECPLKKIEPMKNMHPDKRLSNLMDELCETADKDDSTGVITYLGVYASGDRQSNWISNKVEINGLLSLIESHAAAKVLACIGNNDRLNMLLALLHAPKTVAQLIEECGYNTTGQVYHHLKPLLAVDLIKEDENNRGSYVVQPHRVQGVIMLLAGISDIVDTKYTKSDLL